MAGPQSPLTGNFNPFVPTSALTTMNATSMVYEPLMQYNLARAGKVYPWLATSYHWSNGYKDLTFTLRRGVTWSDGKPFTSADVAFTFQLIKSHPALNTSGLTFSSVTAPTPTTVVFHFPSPDIPELYYIAGGTYIVPKHIWSKVGNPTKYANPHPVGTGPYVLSSGTGQGLLMAARPHYWQKGQPRVRHLQFTVYESNSTLTTALLAGRLDWGGVAATRQFAHRYLKESKDHRYLTAPLSVQGLYFNLKKYPTSSLALRRAVSDVVDRQTISTVGEAGAYPPATSPTGLVLPADRSYLAPQYSSLSFHRSVKAAKAVLRKAGFRMGRQGTLLTPAGHPVALNLVDPSAYSDYMNDAALLKNQLQLLGIKVKIQGLAISAWSSEVQDGNFQLTLDGPGGGPTPYYSYDQLLSSKLSAPIGKPATADPERFMDPRADALLHAVSTTTGPRARQAMYGLEKLMVEKLPIVPLFYFADNSFFSVSRFTGWPSKADMYEPPEAIAPGDEVVVLHLRPRS